MLIIGIGLGLSMQPLILAVQNSVEVRDLGAGTSTITFFRSLGGSFGVAILGTLLATGLTGGIAERLPTALSQLPPEQRASIDPSTFSINEPAKILALPGPVRDAVQQSFVSALHPVFLVAGLVAIVAVVLTLLMPNAELRGNAPSRNRLGKEADDEAAVDMEANAQTMI